MKLLDLFCCAGGAGMGYHQSGFEVVGVDIDPQPRYPFTFVQADAIQYAQEHGHEFDVIHASPPCQAYSNTQKLSGKSYPELIEPTRGALQTLGRPYVIENVVGAPLLSPGLLCGAMFGLCTYRHRLFESNVSVAYPEHPEHTTPTTKMGRAPQPGEFMHVVGNISGVARAREIMEIDWTNRRELSEAIPPAYTRFIGGQLASHVKARHN